MTNDEIPFRDMLAELVEDGFSEDAIILGMELSGYSTLIVCVVRPADTSDMQWLFYNEELSLHQLLPIEQDNEIRLDMDKLDVDKRYYWALFNEGDLDVWTDIPCNQDRRW